MHKQNIITTFATKIINIKIIMARQLQVTDNDKTIIKQIMREKGITIGQLAERMGKARPTVSNLLIKQNMTIDTLTAFANALDVEISDLFPVKSGYVHYSEIRNRVMGFNPTSSSNNNTEQKENGDILSAVSEILPDTSIKLNEPTEVKTTAFCPHCGAKVRVGVVLLAE